MNNEVVFTVACAYGGGHKRIAHHTSTELLVATEVNAEIYVVKAGTIPMPRWPPYRVVAQIPMPDIPTCTVMGIVLASVCHLHARVHVLTTITYSTKVTFETESCRSSKL